MRLRLCTWTCHLNQKCRNTNESWFYLLLFGRCFDEMILLLRIKKDWENIQNRACNLWFSMRNQTTEKGDIALTSTIGAPPARNISIVPLKTSVGRRRESLCGGRCSSSMCLLDKTWCAVGQYLRKNSFRPEETTSFFLWLTNNQCQGGPIEDTLAFHEHVQKEIRWHDLVFRVRNEQNTQNKYSPAETTARVSGSTMRILLFLLLLSKFTSFWGGRA